MVDNTNIKKQLLHLTGLRGIAAYSVFFAHAYNSYSPSLIPGFHIEHLAYFGITLFFVLSGFVITYNYSDYFNFMPYRKALYKFFIARFARLYPLYFLILLPNIHFLIGKGVVLPFLSLTQAWTNKYSISFPPAWSISAECFFYLIFALGITTLNKVVNLKQTIITTALLLLGSYTYLYIFFHHQNDLLSYANEHLTAVTGTNMWDWLQYYSPYSQFCSFIMGSMAAKIYAASSHIVISDREKIYGARLIYTSAIVIIGLFLLSSFDLISLNFYKFLAHQFLYAPFIAILLFACSRYTNALSVLLGSAPMVLAGEISYSVYLLQWQVFGIFYTSTFGEGKVTLQLLYSFIYITMLAFGSFYLIEIPARRFIRKCAFVQFRRTNNEERFA
jgi:peptidoglycan/LPS O-acetylase OafA/YrhL